MKNITKWLSSEGFNFKSITMTNGNNALMVDTDYEGLYPTKEVYEMQNKIFKKVLRFKGLKAESRGFKTAVLISNI